MSQLLQNAVVEVTENNADIDKIRYLTWLPRIITPYSEMATEALGKIAGILRSPLTCCFSQKSAKNCIQEQNSGKSVFCKKYPENPIS